MVSENRSIFNPNSEVLRPFTSKDPSVLGALTPIQRWRLKSREEELGMRPKTGEGAIQRMLNGGNIMWEILSPEGVAQILQEAASELDLPASMFRSTDMQEPLDLLGGRTLIGLLKYVSRHPDREGQPVMPFLMQQAGIDVTGQDIAKAVKKKRQPEWGHIPESAIGELLELVAGELGKPTYMLKGVDFEIPLEILGGGSLKGLLNHYDVKPEREGKNTVNFILERTEIEMDVFNKLKALGSFAFFDQASWEDIGDILRRMADEMEKPVSMVTANDIRSYNVQFLGGRTLRELEQRMVRDGIAISELPTKIGSEVSIEDIIATAKAGRNIIWNRVSTEVLRHLLILAGKERGKPLVLLTTDDLKGGFRFLEGRSIGGLYDFVRKQKPENTAATTFLLEQLEIPVRAEDIIEGIRNNIYIQWERVPWNEIGEIIEMAAEELRILPEMVGSPELIQRFAFLNEHTLGGMYSYANKHREKDAEESTLTFIRRKTGIEDGLRPRRNSRLQYRAQRIDLELQELLSSHDSLSTVEGLLPSIHSIARLYANPFLGIETSEIESEAVVFTLDFISQSRPIAEFSSGLNARLEQYVVAISRPRYRERLLSAPLNENSTITLADVLGAKAEDVKVEAELSDQMNKNLGKLTPIQRELVIQIAVEEREMEELSLEFGMDAESLQEIYYDALTVLRGEIE